MTKAFVKRSLFICGLLFLFVVSLFVLEGAAHVFLLTFVAVLLGVLWYALSKLVPLPHGPSLAITLSSFLLALALLTWWLGPQLGEQLRGLMQQLPESLAQLENRLGENVIGRELLSKLPLLDTAEGISLEPEGSSASGGGEQASGLMSGLMGSLARLIAAVISALGDLFYVLLMSVFFAAGAKTYRKGVVRLFPRARRARATEVLSELYKTLQGWLLGQFAAMITVGLIVGVVLSLLGVPFALGLGFLAFVFEFIPAIGPWLAGIPAVLIAASQSPATALYVVGLFVLVELLEGNVILPLVQRRAVDLPPVITLFTIFLMGVLFGVTGVLVAAPLAAVLLVLVKMLYLRDTLGDEVELPSD